MAQGGADAGDFVGGDAHADAAAADENAVVGFVPGDGQSGGDGEIGIVAAFGLISAEIHHLMAFAGEDALDQLFGFVAPVIAANGNLHYM